MLTIICRSTFLLALATTTIHGLAQDAEDRWKDKLGQRITVRGEAHNAKMGALLLGEGFTIWVDLPGDAWPDGLYHGNDKGELVEVTGLVVQRNDVPVFIPEPGEPMRQSVYVPPGTDPEKARKRYVLENVEWKPAEPVLQQRTR